MDAVHIIKGLEDARETMHARNQRIGEPLISVDPAMLLIEETGDRTDMRIYMRMDHLIALVTSTLD